MLQKKQETILIQRYSFQSKVHGTALISKENIICTMDDSFTAICKVFILKTFLLCFVYVPCTLLSYQQNFVHSSVSRMHSQLIRLQPFYDHTGSFSIQTMHAVSWIWLKSHNKLILSPLCQSMWKMAIHR